MPSGAALALAGCPRTARRKAVRNAGAKALRTGATVALAPSARGHILSFKPNKQRGTHLKVLPPRAYYPNRRVVTPAGPALRRTQQVHDFD